MNNFFEELKKYFETTSQEKILEDWAKSADFDKISPTVEEFLKNTQFCYQIQSEDPPKGILTGNNEYTPKYSSGFFLSK